MVGDAPYRDPPATLDRPGVACNTSRTWRSLERQRRQSMTTEADVRDLALALPEVTERPSHGMPAFYVAGTIFARMHEQEGVLVCWCRDLDEREALLRADPEAFFTTDHYRGHVSVLVRLERVGPEELSELLAEAWAARAPKR